MPKKKKIDGKALIKMIDAGTPQAEIMDKFGFKTSTQLKVAYTNALMEAGKIPEIKAGRKSSAKSAAVDTLVAVNKRGTLVLPKALVESFGLAEGAAFNAKKTKGGLQLKKAN
jgi:hypothetical protein